MIHGSGSPPPSHADRLISVICRESSPGEQSQGPLSGRGILEIMVAVAEQLHRALELIQLSARRGLAGELRVDPAGDQRLLDSLGPPTCVVPLSFGEQPCEALIIDQIQGHKPGEDSL